MPAGAAVALTVRIQTQDFDAAAECAALTAGRADIGALVTFTGLCRDEGGTLAALELEHYPGMAEAEITRICRTAIERFGLSGITAVHRIGRIAPGANIVLVIAAAPHRHAAFDGASFVMDFLKTSAPFWKKEHRADGRAGDWVDARESDARARAAWSRQPSGG
ncbi:molybdenum cofactor biosynthesis protein MoaE [Shinella daejeonensis]|uniref:molybdenum cofactor biosynthesis protein MoaE n=1 Tax=Shinella daejeonensis TaxID=659017 RepID=UPI0020C80669|nr:molybdenum cofactor biosynthesis protein MoaE [Shinella daejeonensis]MCP8895682.1 molybdenum cofactor biosynthesis protein MoaE [Shinella daejeonensis]